MDCASYVYKSIASTILIYIYIYIFMHKILYTYSSPSQVLCLEPTSISTPLELHHPVNPTFLNAYVVSCKWCTMMCFRWFKSSSKPWLPCLPFFIHQPFWQELIVLERLQWGCHEGKAFIFVWPKLGPQKSESQAWKGFIFDQSKSSITGWSYKFET